MRHHLVDQTRPAARVGIGTWVRNRRLVLSFVVILACFTAEAHAAEEGPSGGSGIAFHHHSGLGHEIPGLSFRVFVARETEGVAAGNLDEPQSDAVLQTVISTFSYLSQHRQDFPRFDDAVSKGMLERVIIEQSVHNHEGKTFPFLVVRTVDSGRVRLISASLMKEKGYIGQAEQFASVLAGEFQWVVSKAETGHKPKAVSSQRDLRHTDIRTDRDIRSLSSEERVRVLQQLFETYLRTVDDQRSLEGQSYYEVGGTALLQPSQPDSATKFYDLRVREALQKIVRDPFFLNYLPLAVTNLLNGNIWNVAFVKIDQRDWATRTRVLSAEKAVLVGDPGKLIQPAAILINLHRPAVPDDPFYSEIKPLPMGALSTDQLAFVIAKEIQHNLACGEITNRPRRTRCPHSTGIVEGALSFHIQVITNVDEHLTLRSSGCRTERIV